MGDAYFIGHNARYDKRMINRSLERLKEKNPNSKVPKELDEDKVYCTMVAYKVW